ncbi:A disintegrin and metalloproteinase with thrombospondin motifs adt-1-like isoform X4 [Ruditapes philippinarum]|uniref:A disintegrin and metalloproteinase with thrombospondin motifs adt-1-like isoform X4 n=1 Tax=Ruditapes philippinarum TaxID=129788 RepID=UPI00295B433C|nr:A disintegrin and metalloproteinase with thrombospondin motifs adt-1-like isoform X4 [Ruditapes philippinarum]
MDFGDIEEDDSRSKESILYENTNISTVDSTAETQFMKFVNKNYGPLEFGESNKRKKESGYYDTLKRLKCVNIVITVLIFVLYIALITLAIVLFVPKRSVEGRWAPWSSWRPCNATCGNGTHLRTRTCTNSVPTINDCVGQSLQIGECTNDKCTDAGQWAQWSSWTSCDVTCGKGTHLRTRICTNLGQENDEINCTGNNSQTAECSKGSCPVDGKWAFWSSWTSCDVSCGTGTQLRTRRCSNPMPENKGKDCAGETLESRQCSNVNCSVDGQWAYWSSWTTCDVTCGTGRQLRTRRCTDPLPENGGKDCIGESLQSSQCSELNCSVDGQWAYWSSWTSCDVTCGTGRQLRTRRCTNPMPENGGKDCIGESLQISQCSEVNCSVDGQWAYWSSWTSCDVTCGMGRLLRTRRCTNPIPENDGKDCIGESLQSSQCLEVNCPVDGQWAYWSTWTSCDVTCGTGRQLRTRRCTNPIPANGGKDCIGEMLQMSQCLNVNCSVDGQWAHWSNWTSCDVTCGTGRLLRTRRCTNPMPENGGKDCIGESLQMSQCSEVNCSVDGQWAYWSSWTSCNVTCGTGSQLRTRRCTHPMPENGGKDCIGESLEISQCSDVNCSVDGQWAYWSSWTSCDVTCGRGRQLRTRRCTNPMPHNHGKDCIGESLQMSQCSEVNCSVDGQWAYWASWTSCDVTCGTGRQLRTRRCTNPMPENGGKDCIGESLQSSQCSEVNCSVDGQWAYWSSWTSCDVTCGKGRQLRTRRCTNPMPDNGGKDCIGETLEISQCSEVNCSVDGQWTYWSSWTSCDVTCGKGKQLRTRRCTNPLPENGGKDCIGESLESSHCSDVNCSVDGQWAHWSNWTSCDVTCGKGTHQRSRSCTNPVPANNVPSCTGENTQTAECSNDNCPVDGRWAQWSSWTLCDVTCGNGKHLRLRTCTNPVPMNKGSYCIGERLQSSECSKENCPVNGQWAHWSSWTSCDVTCGKGTRQRSRTCKNPVPANGGLECTGATIETDECSKDACPVDGQWANWSSWTSCDVTCGNGRQLRTRRCTNPMPENKGKDCFGEGLQTSQCSKGNCPTLKSAFSVKSPNTISNINGIEKLTFSSTIYQYGNDFNISTGTYTCNKSGVYHFSVTLVKKRESSRVDFVQCLLYKNRQSLINIVVDPTDDDTDKGHAAISQSIVINLDVGDTVYLTGCTNPSTTMESWSSFTGFLLYDNN